MLSKQRLSEELSLLLQHAPRVRVDGVGEGSTGDACILPLPLRHRLSDLLRREAAHRVVYVGTGGHRPGEGLAHLLVELVPPPGDDLLQVLRQVIKIPLTEHECPAASLDPPSRHLHGEPQLEQVRIRQATHDGLSGRVIRLRRVLAQDRHEVPRTQSRDLQTLHPVFGARRLVPLLVDGARTGLRPDRRHHKDRSTAPCRQLVEQLGQVRPHEVGVLDDEDGRHVLGRQATQDLGEVLRRAALLLFDTFPDVDAVLQVSLSAHLLPRGRKGLDTPAGESSGEGNRCPQQLCHMLQGFSAALLNEVLTHRPPRRGNLLTRLAGQVQ